MRRAFRCVFSHAISAAPERIKNQVATVRTIADGIRHKSDRLDGRMHGQFIRTIRTETVGAGIGPDVASIAAMAAKIDIVDMLTATILPNKNQFMLAPVEGAHAGIGLIPDSEVLELSIDPFAGGQHFVDMAPIGADEMDGAVIGMFGQQAQTLFQKFRELSLGFFTAGLSKFPVLDATLARNVAADRHIIGRVNEN